MNRHLFLIINDGGIHNRLPNIMKDRDNYLDFFTSPEGGAWDDDEIEIYENDFDFNEFRDYIISQQQSYRPYDYLLIVFCGHGFSHNGERYIEIRPDESFITVSQIKDVCRNTRTLFISDACLGNVSSLNECTGINGVQTFSYTDEYRMRCRQLYNGAVMLTPKNSFTAAFAVSMGEEAGEDDNGGIYSQNLLSVAREVIKELKTNPIYAKDDYASFSAIHQIAAQRVRIMTNEDQHPMIEMKRSYHQLPFVVVAKS